jgi:hypothetical protein
MLNVAALRAEHLVRQILRLFLGAPRRRRPPSKTEVRPRSRHPRRHPLSTGHRRGAPTAASCVKASSSSEGASPFLLWAAHHECQDEKVESMMMRFTMATAAVLLGCGSAYAQARLNVSPLPALGMTSPLGVPNAPVGHTGIPLGATELATPGVSPTTSGAAPLIGAPCAGASSAPAAMGSPTTAASTGMGSPMTGASAGMGGSTTGASGGMGSSVPGLSSTVSLRSRECRRRSERL